MTRYRSKIQSVGEELTPPSEAKADSSEWVLHSAHPIVVSHGPPFNAASEVSVVAIWRTALAPPSPSALVRPLEMTEDRSADQKARDGDFQDEESAARWLADRVGGKVLSELPVGSSVNVRATHDELAWVVTVRDNVERRLVEGFVEAPGSVRVTWEGVTGRSLDRVWPLADAVDEMAVIAMGAWRRRGT